jgi:hypothetical protein
MDKHRATHDMLVTQGAGVEGFYPTKYGGWRDDEDPIHDDHAHALIEHAGILWLLGKGWSLFEDSGKPILFRPTLGEVTGDTLIDALLAAVKREVEDGK